jgi:hypothetical protein
MKTEAFAYNTLLLVSDCRFRCQLDEDLLDGSSSTMTLPPGHDVSEINHLTTPDKRPPTSSASRTPTDTESTPTDVEQLAKRIMHQHTKVRDYAIVDFCCNKCCRKAMQLACCRGWPSCLGCITDMLTRRTLFSTDLPRALLVNVAGSQIHGCISYSGAVCCRAAVRHGLIGRAAGTARCRLGGSHQVTFTVGCSQSGEW